MVTCCGYCHRIPDFISIFFRVKKCEERWRWRWPSWHLWGDSSVALKFEKFQGINSHEIELVVQSSYAILYLTVISSQKYYFENIFLLVFRYYSLSIRKTLTAEYFPLDWGIWLIRQPPSVYFFSKTTTKNFFPNSDTN